MILTGTYTIINSPIIGLNPIDNRYKSNDNNYKSEFFYKIKEGGSWNLTGNPIFINGTASGVGAHNWTWARTQPWCSGFGNSTHPFKIENVTIDCLGIGSGIEIKNSNNYYFIIQNCTILNAGNLDSDAGIKLSKVNNGTILNNILTNNKKYGIYLDSCKNFTISNNNFSRSGLFLEGASYDLTSRNSHKINKYNLVNGKSIYYYVNQSKLNFNNFTDAGQIILINCNHSIINHQELTFTTAGLLLYSCKNITASDSIISNNTMYGIKVINSNYNNISKIYLLNNTKGIDLESSSNNLIKNNTISICNYGITTDGSSNFNNLTYNKLIKINTGFELRGDKNIIKNNTLNIGTYGIRLIGDDNEIIGNNFTEFSQSGIHTILSNRNKIIGNAFCKSSITLSTGKNNTLSQNKFNNSGLEFVFGEDDYYSNSIDKTNLVNNKPIYYYLNQSKLNSNNFTNAGQIILINCNDSIISNQNISYTTNGFFLRLSYNTTIFNNSISSCNLGIYMSNSSYSNLTINKLYNVNTGFHLNKNKNTTIESNTLNLGLYGIYLSNSDSNKIIGNNFSDFSVSGIYNIYSDDNKIIGNILYNSCIIISSCKNDTISNNKLSNNKINGIFLWISNWINISENEIYNNYYGIYIKSSNNNIINKNNISYNNIGVFLESSNLTYIINNILIDNIACFDDDGNCFGNLFVNNRCIKTYLLHEDNNSENKKDTFVLNAGLILGIGALVILSGVSCFYFFRKKRFSKKKYSKRHKKIKSSKEILAEFDKEELIELFQEGGISDEHYSLREMDLTLISKDFVKKVDKLGFDLNEKVEFLREMLYFSTKEREAIVNDLFQRLKSTKQKNERFNKGW